MEKKNLNSYVLMDEQSVLLGDGELLNPEDDHNLQMHVPGVVADAVEEAEVVHVIPANTDMPVYLGKVIFRRGNLVVLEPLKKLGREVRRNLRVPVAFTTYIYPETGGRVEATSKNLSCGGIAFTGSYPFKAGDRFQIVIPITQPEPLILNGRVLRVTKRLLGGTEYAAEFPDIINDEETLVRAAVFNVQLNSRELNPRRRKSK